MVQKVVGSFFKIIKSGNNWALFNFVSQDKKFKAVVFAGTNIPSLYQEYEVELAENEGYRTYKLLSFVPNIKEKEIDWVDYISKNVKGIGLVTAKKIVQAQGEKIWENISNFIKDEKPNELHLLLTDAQIEHLKQHYIDKQSEIESLLSISEEEKSNIKFFYLNNLQKLYEFLKEKHKGNNINYEEYYKQNNVYDLYMKDFIPFELVDKFALLIGYQETCLFRFEAFVFNVISEEEMNNSTLIPYDLVEKNVRSKLNISHDFFTESCNLLLNHDNIIVQKVNDKFYFSKKVTLEKEFYILKRLHQINNAKKLDYITSSKIEGSSMSDEQKNAYFGSLENNVSIISGGPGVGKSYIIKYLNLTLKENGLKNEKDYYILTPTGRASTNVSLKIDDKVRTIHSLLKIKDENEEVDISSDEYDKIKVLIIDEFSMVNINIFEKLLKACSNLEHLIILGDVNQLPAIGPGNLLEQMIQISFVKTYYLTKFFRSDSIDIFNFFESVKKSQLPKFKKGIVNLYEWDKSVLVQNITKLFKKLIQEEGIENTIVLAPTYRGDYGLIELNNQIQNAINKDSQEVLKTQKQGKEIIFKLKDRVIQLENRTQDNVYNGDIGEIVDFTKNKNTTETITVKFSNNGTDRFLEYTASEFRNEVSLAYGITVHKFQGSEIEHVIFLVLDSHSFMLNKKLLYTGASRAKKTLNIVTSINVPIEETLYTSYLKKNEILTNFQLLILEKEKEWN